MQAPSSRNNHIKAEENHSGLFVSSMGGRSLSSVTTTIVLEQQGSREKADGVSLADTQLLDCNSQLIPGPEQISNTLLKMNESPLPTPAFQL